MIALLHMSGLSLIDRRSGVAPPRHHVGRERHLSLHTWYQYLCRIDRQAIRPTGYVYNCITAFMRGAFTLVPHMMV